VTLADLVAQALEAKARLAVREALELVPELLERAIKAKLADLFPAAPRRKPRAPAPPKARKPRSAAPPKPRARRAPAPTAPRLVVVEAPPRPELPPRTVVRCDACGAMPFFRDFEGHLVSATGRRCPGVDFEVVELEPCQREVEVTCQSCETSFTAHARGRRFCAACARDKKRAA
jgi:hypothetical protein